MTNHLADQYLDVPGLIRRARRIADLSQRDLAEWLGVCPATVGHWETGQRVPDLHHLEVVLRLAGLRLLVVVAAGDPGDADPGDPGDADPSEGETDEDAGGPGAALGDVLPMRDDGVRDRGGRRYPAHLDPAPLYRVWRPRWDRPELNVLCHRRRRRDAQGAPNEPRPLDHVTAGDVLATLAEWRAQRLAKIRRSMPPRTSPASESAPESEWCTCPVECDENGVCVDACRCRCDV